MTKRFRLLLIMLIVSISFLLPNAQPLYASQCQGAVESGEWFNESADAYYFLIDFSICEYAEARGGLVNYYLCEAEWYGCTSRMENLAWYDYGNRIAVGWTQYDDALVVQWFYFSNIVDSGPGRDSGGNMQVDWEIRWNDGRTPDTWTEYYFRE